MDIRFLGHSCFEIADGDTRLLVDPFLTGNPKAAVGPDEVDPTHILLTHGHGDHIGDTVDIAKRTGAQVIAIVELANEISGDGGKVKAGGEIERASTTFEGLRAGERLVLSGPQGRVTVVADAEPGP